MLLLLLLFFYYLFFCEVAKDDNMKSEDEDKYEHGHP